MAIELALLLLAALGFAYCVGKMARQLPVGGVSLTPWFVCIFGMILVAVVGALAFQGITIFLIRST